LNKTVRLAILLFFCLTAIIVSTHKISYASQEIIIIEEKASAETSLVGGSAPSSAEIEFGNAIMPLTGDVVYDIEASSAETSETSSRHAKLYVKDEENVRIETSAPNAMPIIIVSSKSQGWIYFPKTNTIMELSGNKKNQGSKLYDFISSVSKNRDRYYFNKTISGNYVDYEILEKSGEKKVSYRFGGPKLLEKITIIEKDRATREVIIKNITSGKIDEKLFERPKDAINMPLNEFPNFD